MKKILLLILTFALKIFAQIPDFIYTDIESNIILTNENKNLSILSNIKTDTIKKYPETQLVSAEILYGSYENFNQNFTISKEMMNKSYYLNYSRLFMNNYKIGNQYIYNSDFNSDSLNAGFTFKLLNNLYSEIDLNYTLNNKGMHTNRFYNKQLKRYFVISPNFKYIFSENSKFESTFDYSELKYNYEGTSNDYLIKINNFNSFLSYNKIWTEINAFSSYLKFFQYTIEIPNKRIVNNIATFSLFDKFAISPFNIFDLSLGINLNNKYKPVISGEIKFTTIFKIVSLFIELNREYYPEEVKNKLLDNYFIKINDSITPYIKNSYSAGSSFSLTKNYIYEIKMSYVRTINYPELKEDFDNLFLITKLNFDRFEIINNLIFVFNNSISIYLTHIYIPYVDKSVSYLPKNKTSLNLNFQYEKITFDLVINYIDKRNYFDLNSCSHNLKSYISADFNFNYKIYHNSGLKFKARNINNNKIFNYGNYVEPEKLYEIGIITKF